MLEVRNRTGSHSTRHEHNYYNKGWIKKSLSTQEKFNINAAFTILSINFWLCFFFYGRIETVKVNCQFSFLSYIFNVSWSTTIGGHPIHKVRTQRKTTTLWMAPSVAIVNRVMQPSESTLYCSHWRFWCSNLFYFSSVTLILKGHETLKNKRVALFCHLLIFQVDVFFT